MLNFLKCCFRGGCEETKGTRIEVSLDDLPHENSTGHIKKTNISVNINDDLSKNTLDASNLNNTNLGVDGGSMSNFLKLSPYNSGFKSSELFTFHDLKSHKSENSMQEEHDGQGNNVNRRGSNRSNMSAAQLKLLRDKLKQDAF